MMKSRPINYRDLAGLSSATGLGAGHFNMTAYQEDQKVLEECQDVDDVLDALYATLEEIPESKAKKHDDKCWQAHTACLAKKIKALVWEETENEAGTDQSAL